MARRRMEQLEALARDMVGDGGKPDVFFVSVEGGIVMVTLDFEAAYHAWREYSAPKNRETALENRSMGTIASVDPIEEGSPRLMLIDDSEMFLRDHTPTPV